MADGGVTDGMRSPPERPATPASPPANRTVVATPDADPTSAPHPTPAGRTGEPFSPPGDAPGVMHLTPGAQAAASPGTLPTSQQSQPLSPGGYHGRMGMFGATDPNASQAADGDCPGTADGGPSNTSFRSGMHLPNTSFGSDVAKELNDILSPQAYQAPGEVDQLCRSAVLQLRNQGDLREAEIVSQTMPFAGKGAGKEGEPETLGQNLVASMSKLGFQELNREMALERGIQLLGPNHNEPVTREEKRNIFFGFGLGVVSVCAAIMVDVSGAAEYISDKAQHASCGDCPRDCELPDLSGGATREPTAAALAGAPEWQGTIKCGMRMFGEPLMFNIPLVWLGAIGGTLCCCGISWFAGWCQDATPRAGDRVYTIDAVATQGPDGQSMVVPKGAVGNVLSSDGFNGTTEVQWDGDEEACTIDVRDFDRLRPVEGAFAMCNGSPALAGEEAHRGPCWPPRGPLAYVHRKVNYSRKITHCTGYIINVLVRFVFGASEQIETPASLIFTSAFIMFFWHLFLLKWARKRWFWCRTMFAGMDRPEDRPYSLEWLTTQNIAYFAVWVPVTYALVALDKYQLSLITVLVLAFGDGLAEPIGIKFGKHKYTTRAIWFKDKEGVSRWCSGEFQRSYEGSAVVFVATAISVGICWPWFDNNDQFGCALAVLPVVMTMAEAFAPHSWDNPFLTGVGGGILILILHTL